jgi:hypothetical protein
MLDVLDLKPYQLKLQTLLNIDEPLAKLYVREYKRFLFLCYASPISCCPSE